MLFTIGLLAYGDHAPLLGRCLDSLSGLPREAIAGIRVGLNEPSEDTLWLLKQRMPKFGIPVFYFYEKSKRNVGKYPLMRRMLGFEPCGSVIGVGRHTLATPWWLWFDDDAHITDRSVFWREWIHAAATHDLIGKPYHRSCRTGQREWVMSQPWCLREAIPRNRFHFMQGSLWAARVSHLRRWDYPFRELHHSGGDAILGELAYQQNWRQAKLSAGFKDNDSPRRGLGSDRDTPWPGQHNPEGLRHQDFECVVSSTL